MNHTKIKVGNAVRSTRSWTRFVIAEIDAINQMVITEDGRAISFEEVA